ncbi:MAG TPA: hypothetical protein ENK06_00125 [Gammaproteobacteria bacterium]|nr:hypothetical protein [Gammaproteobacteria bacterium]
MPAKYGSLKFNEAVDFFKEKINLPTRTWTDISEGMHARAFVIAGATKDELLTDFKESVRKGIEDGTTLAEFRKDFDQIVQRHGWQYNGGRGWRTRVVYDTNLRQAYNAGREKQMADPALRKRRPYGRYVHNDASEHPRPEHLAQHNKVVALDDPWWETWTPQNGWGCKCKKFMVSQRDVDRLGLQVTTPDPLEFIDVEIGKRGPHPRTVKTVKGIDPGFAFNPGTAAWGRYESQAVMDAWKVSKNKWQPLTFGGPETFNRPKKVPLDKAVAKRGKVQTSQASAAAVLREILGGDEKVFEKRGLPVSVNAESLAAHIDLNRSQFLPFITEALDDPFEIWMTFEKHAATGKVVLRQRFIKAIQLDKNKGVIVVTNVVRGKMEAWTFIPLSKLKGLDKKRRGQLLYGR